jgi:hypothetical protein
MSLYQHVPHPHIAARKDSGPVRVADQHDRSSAAARFNARAAVIITGAVGSMWCAYAFGLFDLISLPGAIRGGSTTIVQWVAQTFLQLVLLSVIMVGQDVQAKAGDARSQQTFMDAEAMLAEAIQIQQHLQAQDDHLLAQDALLAARHQDSVAQADRRHVIALEHVTAAVAQVSAGAGPAAGDPDAAGAERLAPPSRPATARQRTAARRT